MANEVSAEKAELEKKTVAVGAVKVETPEEKTAVKEMPETKTPETKTAETKTVETKTAEAKTSEEKTAEKATKKTVAKKAAVKKELKVRAIVEHDGKQVEEKEMIARVKKAWTKSGRKVGEIKSMDLYIKPQESAIYYVINGVDTGSVAF